MTTEVLINGEWRKADQEVIDALQACNAASVQLEQRLERIQEAAIAVKTKEHTAKAHPTKDMKIEAWKAKRDLFQLIGIEGQMELFKK